MSPNPAIIRVAHFTIPSYLDDPSKWCCVWQFNTLDRVELRRQRYDNASRIVAVKIEMRYDP